MAVRSVIIVPGLTASYLNRFHWLRGYHFLWPSPTALLTGGFPQLALPLDDQPGLPPPGTQLIPGSPLAPAYGPLAAWLVSRGWSVVPTRADWRRTLSFDGEILLAQVRVQALFGPVGLVCHSRGGLLARYVCGRLAAAGEGGKVEAVVTLGTPHTGSLNAVLNLSCVASLKDRLRHLGEGINKRIGTHLGFDMVAQVIRSWPSVYELLPDPERSTLPPAERQALYRIQTWEKTPYPPHAGLLSAARAAWAALPAFPPSVRVLCVGGENIDTPFGFTRPPSDGDMPGCEYDYAGDGTVTQASAFWPGGSIVLASCAHDCLPLDGRIWPLIHAHLSGETVPDQTLGGYVFSIQ